MFTYLRISGALVLSLLAPAAVSAQSMTYGKPARGGDSTTASASVGWAGYNKGYDGQRFAALDQINTSNVSQLKPLCELIMGEGGTFQTGPVVIGDTMFLTTAHTTVSMDATTCAVNWRQVDAGKQQDPIAVNRGVAYLAGRLYRGMPGARLAALDAASGKVLWDVKVGDVAVGEFISSAPVAWGGMVFVGLAGSDWGIRGRVMGFDAATGKEIWRFYTIPMGSEVGAETWLKPETAKRGGGAMWTSYTLDPEAGELFVPVGNPAPLLDPDQRPGDNLFTSSIVVLDAKTGTLKWWYQATPGDGFDYDLGAPPVLYTTPDGESRVAAGSKDGHVHVVNRRTHELVFKTPITTILNADKKPTVEGIRACPGPSGGVEWNGPAFDPDSRALYVGAVDWCSTFSVGKAPDKFVPGQVQMGTGVNPDPTEKAAGWVTALDGTTGTIRWKFHAPKPIVAGVTPTAGGLVFTGDLGGTFYALDKASGKVLHKIATGGSVAGGVVTYLVGGKQYVATTSGNVSRSGSFPMAMGSPRLIVMSLDVPDGKTPKVVLPEVSARGSDTTRSASGAAASTDPGKKVFQQICSACHGSQGEGGVGANLQLSKRDLAGVIAYIKSPTGAMPKLYPTPLSEADVARVAAYVMTLRK
jgi:alcohol dehydrogenase (cytochrome c)